MNNIHKMRKALVEVKELILDEAEWADEMSNQQAIALGIIQNAISAPPRNCDCYSTLHEALDAWRNVDPRVAGPFNHWLFDEAKGYN